MQVDPIKPMLKAPGTKRLNLKHNELLSNAGFNFNLRRYNKDSAAGIKSLALNLQDDVHRMREELAYLKARATRHKKTAQSNSSRTMYWTLIEVGVLCAVAAVQVLTVRHFFNKVGWCRLTL